ncbi:MAG TPA: DUF642 domain-containing protein [Verrucomicrobiae bacterium]|nr:DUF642 domain-containing protein [Verrucomicrobiae bacterium]
MSTKLVRTAIILAVFAFSTVGLAHAGSNLVTNGSFETGDFSGWTVSGDTTFTGVCDVSTCPGGFAPEDGNYAAYFGPVGDTATISQTIATTPGDSYSLSFYLANPEGGTPNYFNVTFGNSSFSFTNFGVAFGWQQFTLTTLATSDQTNLSFTFRNDPSYWFLDNITVQQSGGTTPEPGTFVLFGSGILGLAGMVRRKLLL